MGRIEKMYPNAEVHFGTFDDYLDELMPHKDKLPVLDKEIADSWIYGVPSDPLKTAKYRAMQREFDACISDGSCDKSDPRVMNFTTQFLKNGEHTWGEDVKLFLNDTKNWYNEDFNAVKHQPNYDAIINSWREQRMYGFDYPLEVWCYYHSI
jgi:hypothetical protein